MNRKIIVISFLVVATFGYAIYHAFVLSDKLDSSGVASRNSVISSLPLVDLDFYAIDRDEEGRVVISETYTRNLGDFVDAATPSIVHFWATWCGPCEVEFPGLMSLAEKLAANSDAGVEFILIAVSDQKSEILKFLRKYNFNPGGNLLVAIDDTTVSQGYFGTFKLPETFYFDSQGELVRRFSGAQEWDTPVFLDFFSAE